MGEVYTILESKGGFSGSVGTLERNCQSVPRVLQLRSSWHGHNDEKHQNLVSANLSEPPL